MNKPVRITFGEEMKSLAKEFEYIACNADTKCCSFEDFGLEYPKREFSIGIAEQNLIGIASGLASCGNKVVLSTYSNFAILRACEQVRTYICNPKMNVVILGTHAGLQTGCEGISHTAIEDIAITRAMPNMTIVHPSDNISAKVLAREVLKYNGPVYVRLPYDAVENVHSDDYTTKIGKIDYVLEYGSDAVIFATGIMLGKCIEAADILQKKYSIFIKVLEVHTIKPIDESVVIKEARETKHIVTVEDHSKIGGLGSSVAEITSEHCPVIMKRIGIEDNFIKSGDAKLLYRDNHMLVEDIVRAVHDICTKEEFF